MADKNVHQKPALDFKTSRQKKITVITNSLIFILLSVCAFGFYSYNSSFFKEKITNNKVRQGEKNIETENMFEETLGEGEKLEFKNNWLYLKVDENKVIRNERY